MFLVPADIQQIFCLAKLVVRKLGVYSSNSRQGPRFPLHTLVIDVPLALLSFLWSQLSASQWLIHIN